METLDREELDTKTNTLRELYKIITTSEDLEEKYQAIKKTREIVSIGLFFFLTF